MVRFPFIFLIPLFLTAPAKAQIQCSAIFSQEIYTESSFPYSVFSPGPKKLHGAYVQWAAKVANAVHESIRGSQIATDRELSLALQNLQQRIGRSRKNLAQSLNHTRYKQFGVLRTIQRYDSWTNVRGNDVQTKEFVKFIHKTARRKNVADGASNFILGHNYLSSSAQRVMGTRFFAASASNGPRYVLLHPPPKTAKIIWEDVNLRLARLILNKKKGEAVSKSEFYSALFGYYNAMPFIRGSASIGNVFFAGLHLYLFETKMRPVHSTDWWAMLLEQDAFVNLLSSR